MTGPDFDKLVGADVPAEEGARLRRAHDALVGAGPRPELPPSLAAPPGRERARAERPLAPVLPRRRLAASLVLAGALLLASFGAGYFVAERGGSESFGTDFVLAMRGTDAAPDARASLLVGEKDDDGNWPMKLTVVGLEPLEAGRRYELVLTRRAKPAVSCGTFAITDERTVAYLDAPYRLKRFDGWAITREGSGEILVRTPRI